MNFLGTLKKGLLFILSAPAGTGKTTLVQKLVGEFPCILQNISFTTRSPRDTEISGDHYNFVTPEEFEIKISRQEFLEYVKLYGDYYGTSKTWVEEKLHEGKHVFLVIDTQGALQLMETIEACFIFINPPSLATLRNRLISRATDSVEAIEKRMIWAEKELEAARFYDYQITNDSLETAYLVLKSIVIAEEHRSSNLNNNRIQ